MKKVNGTYDEVISKAIEYLRERFSRADCTLKCYQNRWEKVKNYMDSNKISEIDASVCRDYLLNEFINRNYHELTTREKEVVGNVNILIEFLETGAVQSKKEQINLDGPIGALMMQYLAVKMDQRLHKNTISILECHLFRFLHFLRDNKIEVITAVRLLHILNYIKSINFRTKAYTHKSIQLLRGFFRYLYNQRILETDLSIMVPRINYKSQPKLPSTYSKEEVEKLIASVERSSFMGRRDYAQEADFLFGINKVSSNTRYLKEVGFRYKQEDDETVTTFSINDNLWISPNDRVPESRVLEELDGRYNSINTDRVFNIALRNAEKNDCVIYTNECESEALDHMGRSTFHEHWKKLILDGRLKQIKKGQYNIGDNKSQ